MYKCRLKITLVSKFWITIYLFFLAALGGSCSLSSRPGIKPGPAAVKAPCPNHLTASEFPIYHISKLILPYIFWHAIWNCNTHFVRLTFFFFLIFLAALCPVSLFVWKRSRFLCLEFFPSPHHLPVGIWDPLDTFRFPFWKLLASLLCNYVVFHIPDALLVPDILDKREVISVLWLLVNCCPR